MIFLGGACLLIYKKIVLAFKQVKIWREEKVLDKKNVGPYFQALGIWLDVCFSISRTNSKSFLAHLNFKCTVYVLVNIRSQLRRRLCGKIIIQHFYDISRLMFCSQ